VLGQDGGISAFFATGYFRGADLATGAGRHDEGFTRLSYLGKPLICPSAVIQRSHLPMIWGAYQGRLGYFPPPAWRLRRHNPSRCPGTGETLIGKLPVSSQTRWVFTDFPDIGRRPHSLHPAELGPSPSHPKWSEISRVTCGAPVLGPGPATTGGRREAGPVLERCYEGPSPGSRATYRSPARRVGVWHLSPHGGSALALAVQCVRIRLLCVSVLRPA
jgi:hypothetical protein